jgi:hypothetical protein
MPVWAHSRRVQGEGPPAVARSKRHPYPAAADRPVHVMHSLGTLRLVRVKRNRDNRMATRISSDPDAEPLHAHALIVAPATPGPVPGHPATAPRAYRLSVPTIL